MPRARKTTRCASDDDYDPDPKRKREPRLRPDPKPDPPRPKPDVTPFNPLQTDSSLVTGPVIEAVHERLHDAYRVHNNHEMCYIFDFVPPARQWKAGTEYSEKGNDVEYGPAPWQALREVEHEDGHRLQAYYPRETS